MTTEEYREIEYIISLIDLERDMIEVTRQRSARVREFRIGGRYVYHLPTPTHSPTF